MNAYMLFSVASRAAILEAHPGVGAADVGRITGAQWKALSTEEKEPWEAKAREDRAKYDAELTALQSNLTVAPSTNS